MIPTSTFRLKIIFITPLLGSQPTHDIATDYLAKKHGIQIDAEEEKLLPDVLEKGTTVFHTLKDGTSQDGASALMNYHILGFLKEAGKIFNRKINGVRNLRYKVQSYVLVTPRVIPLHLPETESIDYYERPLRADGPTGPRVAIARSEIAPEDTWLTCGLEVIESEITQEVLETLLDYGYSRGIGQWRNSGAFGNFRYELTPED